MKYGDATMGQFEAVINKLGGMDGLRRFLSGELVLKTSELLKRLTELSVSATKKFVAKDHIKSANIGWMGSNFKKHFLNKTEENVPAGELVISELNKDSLDAPIIAELGDKAKTSLAHFFQLLENQSNGQSGPLLTNGYANVAYIPDEEGTLWAMYAYWGDYFRFWFVKADSVEFPDGWDAGGRVLSCK